MERQEMQHGEILFCSYLIHTSLVSFQHSPVIAFDVEFGRLSVSYVLDVKFVEKRSEIPTLKIDHAFARERAPTTLVAAAPLLQNLRN